MSSTCNFMMENDNNNCNINIVYIYSHIFGNIYETLLAPLWPKVDVADGSHVSRSPTSVEFYLSCLFCVRLGLIFMQLGMNDTRKSRYSVTKRILNICINYAN